MKVFKKMSGQPTSTSAFKRDKQANGIKIPVGTIIYRWDTMTKLQVVFEVPRNDLDENRVLCNSFELSNPTDVTWFYIEENTPTFNQEWELIDVYPDPIGSGAGFQGFQGFLGGTGSQGPAGQDGVQGVAGVQGFTGSQGDIGAQGSTGIQGVAGQDGVQGFQGQVGVVGAQGNQGRMGDLGTQGFQGLAGENGTQGIAGENGLQGASGSQGSAGADGTQGLVGSAGLQGVAGDNGLQGAAGENGLQGVAGLQGLAGEGGVQGFQGVMGQGGLQGVQGQGGMAGVQGFQGDAGVDGSQGVMGLQGNAGAQGSVGSQGSVGFQGVVGVDGTQGIMGFQGNVGLQGAAGLQGVIGENGVQGNAGIDGLQGIIGDTGTQGAVGDTGVQGVVGLQGMAGTQGLVGAQGTAGAQGNVGFQGSVGESGLQGVVGESGFQGDAGFQGAQGENGVQGLAGVDGLQGPVGDIGTQGTAGFQGVAGVQGLAGTQGLVGEGIQGVIGAQGSVGSQGDVGFQGVDGFQGTIGAQGAQGVGGIDGVQGSIGVQGVQGSDASSAQLFSEQRIPTGIPWDARGAAKITVSYNQGTDKIDVAMALTGADPFVYYIRGVRYSVGVLPGVFNASVTPANGVWYVFISEQNVFTVTQTPWNIYDPDVLLWNFYYNDVTKTVRWIGEERHTAGRDIFQHARNHAQGAIYKSGMLVSSYNGLTAFSSNDDNNFGRAGFQVASGSFFDEDILNAVLNDTEAATLNSTTDGPSTDWNLSTKQYLGFTDIADAGTTGTTVVFPVSRTLKTGQAITLMAGNTTTVRATAKVNVGGTGTSFAVTIVTGGSIAAGDAIVVGARIPIYYVNGVVDGSYRWNRLATTDFLGALNPAATWARTGTTATVTLTNHGLLSGDVITITATSDANAIPIGEYVITGLTANTFSITCLDAGGATGTLSYAVAYSAGNIVNTGAQFNNPAGGFSPVTSTRYYPVYLLATNSTSEPIIAILGQGQSTNNNLTTALGEAPFQFANLVGLSALGIQEQVPFYRLAYEYNSGAGLNQARIKLRSVSFINLRVSTATGVVLGGGASSMAASQVFTDVTNFNGLLTSADTTVQKALETLSASSAQGPQGLAGEDGVQGFQGDGGTQGVFGMQGGLGAQGLEGVQGLQGPVSLDFLSENRTVTIPAGSTEVQVQALIDAQPKMMNGFNLTFQFEDGTYTLNDSLLFSDFIGGAIFIYGNRTTENSGNVSVLHDNQNVVLDFSAVTTGATVLKGGVWVRRCGVVSIYNLKVLFPDQANMVGIYLDSTPRASVRYCSTVCAGKVEANTHGLRFNQGCNGDATLCYVSDGVAGITASWQLIYADGNMSTGTIPNYGLYGNGGTIFPINAVPQGLLKNSHTTLGGSVETFLTASKTVTIPAGSTAAQIQNLINAQPRNLNSYTLTFQFEDGTYTLNATLLFPYFYGGPVIVQGNISEANATVLHTTQAVHLNFSTLAAGACILTRGISNLTIRNFKVTVPDTASAAGAQVDFGTMAVINYCYFVGTGKTSTPTGIYITNGGSASASANYVSNLAYGLRCVRAILSSNGNDDTGTAPNYGLVAANSGHIDKTGIQPVGTTANESAATGGVIA